MVTFEFLVPSTVGGKKASPPGGQDLPQPLRLFPLVQLVPLPGGDRGEGVGPCRPPALLPPSKGGRALVGLNLRERYTVERSDKEPFWGDVAVAVCAVVNTSKYLLLLPNKP